MNEPPPIPQPHRFTCPRCGFGFDQNAAYCPNCGAPLAPNASSSAGTVVAQILLCLAALCSGGFGACMFLLAGIEGGKIGPEGFIFVGVPILITVACIWGVFRLAKKKK